MLALTSPTFSEKGNSLFLYYLCASNTWFIFKAILLKSKHVNKTKYLEKTEANLADNESNAKHKTEKSITKHSKEARTKGKKTGGKNKSFFEYTGSALHSTSYINKHLQKGAQSTIKCIFSRGDNWSGRCSVVTDSVAKKKKI